MIGKLCLLRLSDASLCDVYVLLLYVLSDDGFFLAAVGFVRLLLRQ